MSRLVVNQIQAKTGGEIEIPSGQTIRNNGTAVGFGLSTATDTLPGEGGSGTTVVAQGLSKSWVNFKGTTTTELRDSFNCSGLTDNGTGDTTSGFTSNMNNALYALTASAHYGSTYDGRTLGGPENDAIATDSIRVDSCNGSANSKTDLKWNAFSIHGDLA